MKRVGDGDPGLVARARAEVERKLESQPPRVVREPPKGPVDRMERTPSDLELLSQVFGAPRVASAEPTAVASRSVAVERLSWARSAEAVLGATLGKVPGALWTLQGKADAARQALVEHAGRAGRGHVGLLARASMHQAAGRLETMAYRLGLAAALSRLRGEPRSSLRALVAAREAVSAAYGEAEGALESLAGSVHGLLRTAAEIRDVALQARASENELRATYGKGVILEQAIARAGLAPETAVAPGLSEADLQRLGSALDPTKPWPQTVWSEGIVNRVCELGRQQGGVSDADGARHYELARIVLAGEGARVDGPAHAISPADLAAVLARAGLPLEKVDPNQLASAARYVSSATSLSEQQDKLRKTLDNFQALSSIGLPRMSRHEMVEELWAMAKVPGHALQKLTDAEIHRKLQEVAGALNGGPGPTQIKIGKHNLKLEIGEGGQILGSSCKKPGFFSKVWSGIKKVAPIVLTVASFIPATAPFARAVQGAIGLVNAIRTKSLIGLATAGAGLVGAGAAIARGASQMVGSVESLANAAGRTLQGIASARRGNLLGGLAGIGSGLAGGIGAFAGDMSKGLGKAAERLDHYSNRLSAVAAGTQAARSYQVARQAVDEARQALATAQASGDRRAVAEAQRQLTQVERQQRASLLGAAGGAFEAASLWVGDKASFPGQAKKPAAGVGLESRLQLASRSLSVARDVSAGDYVSAAVSGLGVAANLDVARHPGGTTLGDASRLADAGFGAYRSQRGLESAHAAVADAEARVRIARASGDRAAVEQAEAALRQARRGLETSVMGAIAAGESVVETAAAVRGQLAERAERAEQQRLEAERARETRPAEASGEALASAPQADTASEVRGFAALREKPEPYDVVAVEKGRTVWEVSMRTGVPVARILEFNQENGNALDPQRLAVGTQILVPTKPGEVRFQPKSGDEVRAMQRAARAQRGFNEQVSQALGIPGVSSDEAKQLRGLVASVESRNTTAAAAELEKLLGSSSPLLQQFAREEIGRLEADRLTSIQHLNTGRISEIGAAVAEATDVSAWSGLNPLTAVRVWLGHDDNVRTIGLEQQTRIQDQQLGVGAIQQIRRATGVTLHELAKMAPSEIDGVLRRANPQLDSTRVATLRGQILRSLGNPDVSAVARGSFNFGSFSWEQGKAAAETSFADGLLSPVTRPVMAGLTSAAGSLGDGLRHLRAGSEAAKTSSSFYESYSGHFVSSSLDLVSDVSRFTDTVKYAEDYWTSRGGVTGLVGDKLAWTGGLLVSPVTSTAKLFDHRASDAERTAAMVEVGLMLATLGASRAGVGSLVGRTVSREAAALARTRVGAALASPVDDLARAAGAFTLRQGTRAADALGSSVAGRSLLWANQNVLSPLTGVTTRGAAVLNRTADAAADYFVWANNFGKGPVMTTGARVLEKTGLAELQAKHAAEKAYAAIRNSTDDVARIAKTTGRSEAEIAQIKNHLFDESHRLSRGLRRFDADPQIAAAWQRLQRGVRNADDLALLEHELAESMLMKAGMSQKAAHAAADRPVAAGTRTSAAEGIGAAQGAGAAARSPLTPQALTFRRYVLEIENQAGIKMGREQRRLLVEHLQKTSHSRLSRVDSLRNREAFDRIKDKLIAEWERKTGQSWPRYQVTVPTKRGDGIYRRSGQLYDPHHVIEASYGGPPEWWNIFPLRSPGSHQGGIHGSGSVAYEIFRRGTRRE
jgi:LysM repeat protein